MIQTMFAYIQLIHVGIILWITLQLYKYPNNIFDQNICIAELVLTVINVFVIKKWFNLIPIMLSLCLFSKYLPEDMHWIVVLFLGKILYANDILANTKKLLFAGDHCSFCQLGGIIYSFVRFTLVEYLFLGIVIMIYKLVVINLDKSGVELPQTYVLFYQMMVTATTIGYGDVCPKSRIQMNFFIGAIPFICGSFVIYGNNVNPLWEELLAYWNGQSVQASENVLQVASLSNSEKQSMNQFAKLSAQRKREQETLRQSYFGDWISIGAINYEKQAELIHTIVDSAFPKEIKLSISSRIRQQFFPKEWVILNTNDISSELYMIAEGQIDFNGQTKGSGFIFNQQGFFCQALSNNKITTKTFVSVWAISLVDLEELGTNCPSVKNKINQNISVYS